MSLYLFITFLCAAATFSLASCRAELNDKLYFIGRFDLSNKTCAKCEWSGSAVAFRFKAPAVSAVIADTGAGSTNKFGGFNNNYILPVIDNVPRKKIRLKTGKHTYVLAENLKNCPHSITIYKCTEAFVGTVEFIDFIFPAGGKFLPPPPPKKRFIEFIGDSVTCAYGNEAKSEKESFAPITENNFLSYAQIAARKLDADCACIAWSGKGVYRNYDGSTNDTILDLYDKVLPASSGKKYNFNERKPQFVVINIGANDFAKPDLPADKFINCYEKLIYKVHKNYPSAKIILIGTSKNAPWSDKQFELLQKIKQNVNLENLYLVKLKMRNVKKNGYGADWHPSVKSHFDMAEDLAENIRKIINGNIRIINTNNKFWLANNINEKFLARGVNCILPRDWADGEKYYVLDKFKNNYKIWSTSAWERLEKLGFNSAGAWCAEEIYQLGIPHTRSASLGGDDGAARLIDVFSKNYEKELFKNAEKQIAPFKNEIGLIGFFANNELPWYGEFGWPTDPMKTLFDKYMSLPATAAGKKEIVNFLKNAYSNSFSQFKKDWEVSIDNFSRLQTTKNVVPKNLRAKRLKHEWAGVVADKYFSLAQKAIKKYAPDKLFLGARFACGAYESVIRSCGKYADVISLNYYKKDGKPDIDFLNNIYALTKKPIMITEFSFTAKENASKNINTKGVDVLVENQKERAEHYKTYCETIMKLPYIIGWDWFQYFDQPPGGRFDGENSNYGIFSINDKIYKELSSAMSFENAKAEEIHENSLYNLPQKFNKNLWRELQPVTYNKSNKKINVSWLNFSEKIPEILSWGDPNGGSKISSRVTNNFLLININTGTGWGCGFDLLSNSSKLNADKSVDVSGADEAIITAKIPKGMNFVVQLNESGAREAGAQAYAGIKGADGESFTAPPMCGKGEFYEYAIPFSLLELRQFYGNQRGNRNIDLQAIKSIAFYFPGNQGNKKIYIKEIKFK